MSDETIPSSKAEVDRAALHYILWSRAHPRTRMLRLVQVELARELRVNKFTMNKVIQTMVREGRLTVKGDQEYLVNDPLDWLDFPDEAAT